MVSKFKSLLFSAPQTLHLFLLSLEPNPPVLRPLSRLVRLKLSLASAARLNLSSFSFSMASSSASGVSGIVSKLEMLGLRERADVGVDGIDDMEETERLYVRSDGKDSWNFVAEKTGDWAAEVGALVGIAKGIDETW
jgi:hypothetical protein